jgi:PRC-barrel domain protein
MERLDIDTALGWRGRTVRDRDGEEIGTLGDVFLDAEHDLPAYAGVRTGLFGRRESIVPLDGIGEHEETGDLWLPYERDLVRGAPSVDPDAALSEDEETALGEHYGHQVRRDAGISDADDETMLRSEEEVATGTTEMRPAERVRLRKVRVTENVTREVPVRREEIRLETEPPPEGRVERVEELGDER